MLEDYKNCHHRFKRGNNEIELVCVDCGITISDKTNKITIKTAGRLEDDILCDYDICQCGKIKDGIGFRMPDGEGAFVVSFEDLCLLVDMAKKVRGL